MSFPTTHWSLLARASWDETAESRRALETLCGRYWVPIHTFVRARVPDPEAQDLTQEFMLHLLQKSFFSRGERVRGRFRSFLLGALVRFLADASDKERALKRGGGIPNFSWDALELAEADPHSCPPESARLFDREWALTILESALQRVRSEYAATGREALLVTLEQFLPGAAETPTYQEAARQSGLSLAALKSEVHRVRRRFREAVRGEVAETVSAPHETEQELVYLGRVLMEHHDNPARG